MGNDKGEALGYYNSALRPENYNGFKRKGDLWLLCWLLPFLSFKNHHRFDVDGLGEHIEGFNGPDAVSLLAELFEVLEIPIYFVTNPIHLLGIET